MASSLQPSGGGGSIGGSSASNGANGNSNGNGSGGNSNSNKARTASSPASRQQAQPGPTVLTFALKHRPRATRASVPKVRTGCKTCKKRHVKCDEAKPACSRCLKWQGFCEGYDAPPAETTAAAAAGVTATGTERTSSTSPRRRPSAGPSQQPVSSDDGGGGCARPANNKDRASSTSSSSAATQGSRRTTPSSDVSASESATTATIIVPKMEVKREPGLDDDVDYEYEYENDGLAVVLSAAPRQTRQPVFKREYDEDEDEYDDADYEYAYDAYDRGQQQPSFDLSLIHHNAAASSSASSSLSSPTSASAFPLEPNYNSVMFASQCEKAYFDSWLTLAPNLGGGWFPSHLWTSTIPQLCRDEPAVRFAAIAIGAMAQAMAPALLGRSYHHMIGNSAVGGSGGSSGGGNGSDIDSNTRAAGSVVPHYRNALTYYGHALRLLRLQGLQGPQGGGTGVGAAGENKGGPPPSSEKERAAVLSCLLFVCFEALQGNREGALRHITHGLQIVDQFVARNVPPPAAQQGRQQQQQHRVGEVQEEEGDAERQRRRQRQRQRDRQLRLSTDEGSDGNGTGSRASDALARVLTRSPAPYVLEDEVMQVFRRLDFQAWSLGVFRLRRTRPADITFQALDALNPATIPARFDSLDDARHWWDVVQHWVLQFPRYMVAALQRCMDAMDAQHPDAAARAAAAGRMLDICDVPGAREIQREYLACLARWNAAFWPLYDAARRHKRDGPDAGAANGTNSATSSPNSSSTTSTAHEAAYLKAASLQIQYLLAWIGVSSLVYSDYEAMYQLTPQFRELNRLAALVLPKQPRYAWSPFGRGASSIFGGGNNSSASGPGELFTMDNGPTMALFVVSCKCRVEAVRDEAIRLLAAYPRRDGFWDSKILWAIADWNRVIESDNETEGSLYEQWLRLRQREAIFDETKPEVQMTAYIKNATTGQFEKVTQTVRWDR